MFFCLVLAHKKPKGCVDGYIGYLFSSEYLYAKIFKLFAAPTSLTSSSLQEGFKAQLLMEKEVVARKCVHKLRFGSGRVTYISGSFESKVIVASSGSFVECDRQFFMIHSRKVHH